MTVSRCLYTVIAFTSIVFGVINLVSFKISIFTNLTLILFYVFAILCLGATIVSCWLDVYHWYLFNWLFFNALVRTFEISFAWC